MIMNVNKYIRVTEFNPTIETVRKIMLTDGADVYSILSTLEDDIENGRLIYTKTFMSTEMIGRLSVCDFLKASNWHFNTMALNYYCWLNDCSVEEGTKAVKTMIAQHNRFKSIKNKK